jgi:hypothetical protein
VSFETSGPLATVNILLASGAEVGDRVRVLYDPSNPSNPNRVRRDGASGLAGEIFYVLLFLAFAAWTGRWAADRWFDVEPRSGD